MGLFSTDITTADAKTAQARLDEIRRVYGVENIAVPLQIIEEEKKCIKFIQKYNEQQQDAEDSIKSGLNAALKLLMTFLPKEIKSKIPKNAIDLLFGFIHKPEILVDLANEKWEIFCDSMGVPSECIQVITTKAGKGADIEAILRVYNPNLSQWIVLEYQFRSVIDLIRKQADALDVERDIKQAYTRGAQSDELTTLPIALSQSSQPND